MMLANYHYLWDLKNESTPRSEIDKSSAIPIKHYEFQNRTFTADFGLITVSMERSLMNFQGFPHNPFSVAQH